MSINPIKRKVTQKLEISYERVFKIVLKFTCKLNDKTNLNGFSKSLSW